MDRLSQILNLAKTKNIDLKNQRSKIWDKIILLCREKESKDFFIYEYTENTEIVILCKNAKKQANNIANLLFNDISKYITIHSYLRGKENIISIDGSKSIYLYENEISNNLVIEQNILNNIHRIFYLSRILYHPSILLDVINENKKLKHTQIAILQEITNCFKRTLRNKLNKTYLSEINNKIEGGRIYKKNIIVKKNNNKNEEDVNAYLEKILCRYESLLYYNNKKYIIASSSNSWELIKSIKNKLNKSKFNKHKYDRFYYEISQNFIYNDFRLKRIALKDKKTNDVILYIFNNLEYEAIPCIENKLLDIVMLRYELYNIIFLTQHIDLDDINIKLEKVFNIFREFILKKYINIEELSYAGEYKEDKVEKIRLGGEMIRL